MLGGKGNPQTNRMLAMSFAARRADADASHRCRRSADSAAADRWCALNGAGTLARPERGVPHFADSKNPALRGVKGGQKLDKTTRRKVLAQIKAQQ